MREKIFKSVIFPIMKILLDYCHHYGIPTIITFQIRNDKQRTIIQSFATLMNVDNISTQFVNIWKELGRQRIQKYESYEYIDLKTDKNGNYYLEEIENKGLINRIRRLLRKKIYF